jgi:hypothetical protein
MINMKAYKGGKSGDKKSATDPHLLRVMNEWEQKGKKVVANVAANKYSAALLELVRPFHRQNPALDELEHLINYAVIAWNIATMKKDIGLPGNVMLQEVRETMQDDKEGIKIVEKLIKEKTKRFSSLDLLIHEFRLEPDEQGAHLIVTARSLTDFMMESLDDDKDLDDDEYDDNEDSFAPGYVNRVGFSLVPKTPFIEWMEKVEGPSLFPPEITETPVYLLREMDSNEEVEAWLRQNFELVFQNQLQAWYVDENKWPKNRTYQLFTEWFSLNHHSMIFDLEDFPVDKEPV